MVLARFLHSMFKNHSLLFPLGMNTFYRRDGIYHDKAYGEQGKSLPQRKSPLSSKERRSSYSIFADIDCSTAQRCVLTKTLSGEKLKIILFGLSKICHDQFLHLQYPRSKVRKFRILKVS